MIKIEITKHEVRAAAMGTGEDIIKELAQAVFAISTKLMDDFPPAHINKLQTTLNLALISSVNAAAEKHK